MARGIALLDFVYEIDNEQDTPAIISSCLLRMDKWNVGTAATSIKKSTLAEPITPFHTSLRLNEKEFGIHPRHLVCEYLASAGASACYGTQPKRIVLLPVLTLAQFNTFKEYNKQKGGTQTNTTVNINHSFDGNTKVLYKILKKISQEMI
jgi:hypothetical protein